MRVVISTRARRDLASIIDYVAEENPRSAMRLYDRLLSGISALDQNPERYVVARRRPADDIRKLVIRPYLVFYSVAAEDVSVLAIIHGARDYAAILDKL